MTDLPATKIAELIERARAAIDAQGVNGEGKRVGDVVREFIYAATPATILSLAEEILRRRADEKRP